MMQERVLPSVPPIQSPTLHSPQRTSLQIPAVFSPNIGTQQQSVGRAPMKRALSDSVPGLMSVLKRKATGVQECEPGRKMARNNVGMPSRSTQQMTYGEFISSHSA